MKKILVTYLMVISILSADNNITMIEKASNIKESIKDTTTKLLDDNKTIKIDAISLYNKCKGCHGSDGKIKALNISPIIASQNMDNLILKLKAYKFGKLNNYGMGRLMTTQTENLSIKEIELLAKYISNL